MRLGTLVRAAVLATLLPVPIAGCSQKAELPDAYYAQDLVPLYPHARLMDQMGSNSLGDGPGASWDGMAWWFRSKDRPERIVAYYDEHLHGWQKDVAGDGEVVYRTVPPGGEDGEEVYVRIKANGEIQIGESVKSGKKASRQS
ncbi:MAG TPA: hypothetical protein VMJ70_05860 [Candidatus Sulfotelmatobacter sp.]|nr:hypothetical protein [Candidatus Sulfotelmatobacter sp.]